jgi:GNAT superfamily N-acetyltransferase
MESVDAARSVKLSGGRSIAIRPMSGADVDLLGALYAAFPAEDLHRRFFSRLQPLHSFLEAWTTAGERGGFSVLALLHDGESVTPVGEAGYTLLANGDGELAVAVAPEWRGSLGAHLVGILAEHAAEHGIPCLEADVLAGNMPMIRLLAHRGAVAMDHADGTVRLVIGTSGSVPAWPPAEDRPRVLIEVAGGRWSAESDAHAAGLATRACSGPDDRSRRPCPVMEGHPCSLAVDADAIVVLVVDDERREQLVRGHQQLHPGVPVFVVPRSGRTTPSGCVELPTSGAANVIERLLSVVGGRADRAQR